MSEKAQMPRPDPGSRASGVSAPRTTTGEMHLLDYLAAVYRYRVMASSAFLLVILGSLLDTYTTTPMYRAEARLMIELEDEQTTALSGAIRESSGEIDPTPYYQTQYRILTGRELSRRTVKQLDLNTVPEFGDAEGIPRLNQLAANVRAMFGLAAPPAAPQSTPIPETSLAAEFMSRISVSPIKNSRLVDVGFVAAEPEFAARAVNQLAAEYVAQNMEVRRQSVTSSLTWLSQELVRQKAKMKGSERAMATYREQQNAGSLEDRQNIVVSRLNQLNDAVTRAKTNRVQKEALYNQIKSLGSSVSPDTMPAILQNPYIQTLKTQVADLQREKANLSERYGDRHPEIIKVSASIRDAQRQLELELSKAVDAIRNDYQASVSEEDTLSVALDEQKGAASSLGRKNVSYTVLEREAHSNRQVYESLLQREKELEVLASSRGNNVRLLESAEAPGAPFTPNLRRSVMLSGLAGLVLAIGLVAVMSYLDDTIKTPEDVTAKLNVPFLGMVPKVKGNTVPLLSSEVPHVFGEAFRSIRTSLVFSNGTSAGRVILVTSAQPLEGKTTTACNMAFALAIGGERVLLIDADLRRPGVTRTLGLEASIGLSHLLTGQATPREAIHKMETPNLWVMPSGRIPPNPSELLASDQMKTLLNTNNGWFDWIIVDTPPVLAVTDAVLLAPLTSGVAFIVGSEMTPRRHVRRALDTVMTGQPRLLGVVLNGIDLSRNKYYYSRYYGYEHTNYYTTSAAS